MIKLKMVPVQGGAFMMGSNEGYEDEKSVHQVTLSSFYIGQFTVTQKEWEAVMGSNPSEKKGDDLPVTNVSWNDVQEFIQKLNTQTGKQYRLPTEAEWEYAARGGTKSTGFKYAGSDDLDEVAWYQYNCKSIQPVGQKKPNELGLYDMSGNVNEWCQDWYDEYLASEQINPKGPDTGNYQVSRGGSWGFSPQGCLVAFRFRNCPDNFYDYLGFRLVHDFDTFNQPEKSNSNMKQTIKINYNFEEGKERVKVALINTYLESVKSSSIDCERILERLSQGTPQNEDSGPSLDRQMFVLVMRAKDLLDGANFLFKLQHLVDKADMISGLLTPSDDTAIEVRNYIAVPEIQNVIIAALLNVEIEEVGYCPIGQ